MPDTKPSTGEDRAPSDYVAALVREGKVVEAIMASHIERCFLYGCAISGDTHCKYCGRFIAAHPRPLGIVESMKRAEQKERR